MTTTDESTRAEHATLLSAVHESVRHHGRLERIQDRTHHCSAVICAIGGSATIMLIVAELPNDWAWLPFATALLAAAASSTALILDPTRKARTHATLARRYLALEYDIARTGSDITAQELAVFRSRRVHIQNDN